MKSNYLIIGCGNHGSRILDIFVKKKLPVVVVEKNQERIVELKILYSSNHQIIFVDSLEKGLAHLNDRYSCVLSNWANDRFSELIRLKNNGCNKVFLEKPFASSIKDLDKINNLFSKNFVLVPSLPQNFSDFHVNIKNLIEKYDLGDLNYIIHFGGAKGLMNNGIHYLDTSLKFINSELVKTVGFIDTANINPRNKESYFYDGNIIFKFKDGKSINISMSNQSMMNNYTIYNFKFGNIILNEDDLGYLNFIKKSNRELPITRTRLDETVILKNIYGNFLEYFEKNINFFIYEKDIKKFKNYFEKCFISQRYLLNAVHKITNTSIDQSLNIT